MKRFSLCSLVLVLLAGAGLAQYSPIPPQPRPNYGTINGTRSFSSLSNLFVAATNGNAVEIGPGTWTVTTHRYSNTPAQYALFPLPLISKTNVVISCYGTEVVGTNFGSHLIIFGCSNVAIRGLTIRGGLQDATNFITAGLWFLQSAVTLMGTNYNITLEDCTFINCPNWAILTREGWTDGLYIRRCRFLEIGQTNVPAISATANDGGCVGGLFQNVLVESCYGKRVVRFFEFEPGGMTFPFVARNAILMNNTVEDVFDTCVALWPNGPNCTLNDLNVKGNSFLMSYPFQNTNDHYMLSLYGGTNVLIEGNTFVGGKAGVALDFAQLLIADNHTNLCDVSVLNNTFRGMTNSAGHAVKIVKHATATRVLTGLTIQNNVFDSTQCRPLSVNCSNVTFIGNVVRPWSTPSFGVQVYADANNFTAVGNTFFSPSASDNLLWSATTASIVWFDNEVRGTIPTTAFNFALAANCASNMLWRGYGAGAPAFPCKTGSQYMRTDTSAVGSLYVQTNSVGVNGWRPNPN